MLTDGQGLFIVREPSFQRPNRKRRLSDKKSWVSGRAQGSRTQTHTDGQGNCDLDPEVRADLLVQWDRTQAKHSGGEEMVPQ